MRVRRIRLADYKPLRFSKIAQDALAGLRASLDKFGVLALPVCNKKTMRVLDGSHIVDFLAERGDTHTQAVVISVSEEREQEIALALKNHLIEGEFVPQLVHEILAELKDKGLDESTIRKLRLDKLPQLAPSVQPIWKPRAKKSAKATKHTRSVLGAVYALGDHRLIVSSVDDAPQVNTLRRSPATFALCSLDPPRGGTVEGDWLDRHLATARINASRIATMTALDRVGDLIGAMSRAGLPIKDTSVVQDDVTPMEVWQETGRPIFLSGSGVTGASASRLYVVPKSESRPPTLIDGLLRTYSTAGDVVLDVPAVDSVLLTTADALGRVAVMICPQPSRADQIRQHWCAFKTSSTRGWDTYSEAVS